MKGIFKTHIKKYLFCLFFIIAGSIIAVKFGLWGIDAVRSGKIAAAKPISEVIDYPFLMIDEGLRGFLHWL